jgi:hypothetical protein
MAQKGIFVGFIQLERIEGSEEAENKTDEVAKNADVLHFLYLNNKKNREGFQAGIKGWGKIVKFSYSWK